MRLITALLSVAFLGLAACGTDSSSADAGYAFSTGTYAVSSATLTSATDECGLLPSYQEATKKIGVVVSGTTATFNLANDPNAAAGSLPSATVNKNSIESAVEANYTVSYTGPDCVVRVKRSVVGDLMADNKADLSLSFAVTKETGSCSSTNTSFAQVPCTSAYHFTATKQP